MTFSSNLSKITNESFTQTIADEHGDAPSINYVLGKSLLSKLKKKLDISYEINNLSIKIINNYKFSEIYSYFLSLYKSHL